MPIDLERLDPKTERLLSAYPVRASVRWRMENGRAVLVYKKNLSLFERKLQALIGGPDVIRRPLDSVGTDIWLLCDGQHTLADICTEMDQKYRERIEPVLKRVWSFIQMLLELGLLTLSEAPVEAPSESGMEKIEGFGEVGKRWSDARTVNGKVVKGRKGRGR